MDDNDDTTTTETTSINDLIKETDLPGWLQPPRFYTTDYYTNAQWEECLQRISEGETLKSICKSPHMPRRGDFIKWIYTDPARKKKYREAQTYAAEAMADDILDEFEDEFDENGAPKNLDWVRQKNDQRKFLMQVYNRDRFSDKQNNVAVQVNMGDMALSALRKRTINHDNTIEGEVVNDGE